LEAFCESVDTWLAQAFLVCGVEVGEHVVEEWRLTTELDDERREQCAGILLSGVLEIKKEYNHVR
jgi:hypothetical protein